MNDRTVDNWQLFESPVGPLTLVEHAGRLRGVIFPNERGFRQGMDTPERPSALLTEVARQLERYFLGEPHAFELPLELIGTPFQLRVWEELRTIPYGETVSYGELARRIGSPGEAREVGGAVGRTPTPIVVPCHRVIGADGSLVGYGGGLERKRALLDLEQGVLPLLAAGSEGGWLPTETEMPTATEMQMSTPSAAITAPREQSATPVGSRR
jgi:methylated-DNA-[protein]-cysteine S-methyltransferase